MVDPIYVRCDQKITVTFKFFKLRVFDFRIFFCYVGKHICCIYWQYQAFWIVSLFLTEKKFSSCFGLPFDFLLCEKMDQRNCIKLMIGLWFQCHSHTSMIRYQLWSFWANLDRCWTSSISPKRCSCNVVFAQNFAILEQSSLLNVEFLKHP